MMKLAAFKSNLKKNRVREPIIPTVHCNYLEAVHAWPSGEGQAVPCTGPEFKDCLNHYPNN